MTTIPRKGSSHLLGSLHTCKLKLQEDQRQQEKSVIAQPIFVFKKREHTFKRPAEENRYEAAEPECNGFSRKRMRSSSFTFHITDSQSQGVRKNNVFMTSTLVQSNVDIKSAEQGPVKHSEHVLRPAILQLPQARSCAKAKKTFGHKALESCKKTKNKISEGNSYLLSENVSSARISVQLSTNQHFLGATSVGFQPNEDKCFLKSCGSNFVFGENMVERVLGTQKLTQPQLENDSYAKEKPFKSTPKFPINFLSSRTDSIKNTSLIESAAAFSSQPSRKCLLEKIDVITGEETEHNVLKVCISCFTLSGSSCILGIKVPS
uniref:RAN binding protein 3 like n=1 Tax=Aotus nancymaae TaxID=37293 RepID=A0A2K5E1H6_AOTNA